MVLATLFLVACSDSDKPGEIETPIEAKELLILSEGAMGSNNSTLARLDLLSGVLNPDYFRTVNKRGLGDVGNDMIQYGAKIFIVVNKSSTIEVVEASSGKSLKQIPMKSDNGQAREPRRLAAGNGKIYVTSFDDTVTRIDTASLQPDGKVTVGMDPEGIAFKNNKIYVANSGGLNWANGYDHTVSVINAVTFTEDYKVEVGTNPGTVQADSEGDVYVSVTGNYNDIPAAFKKIDAATGEVTPIDGIMSPIKFIISNNKAYIINGTYGEPNRIIVFDCLTEKILTDNFITDGPTIETINNISVDGLTGDLFVAETDYITPGNIHCFDKNGKLKYTLTAVGMNPSVVVVM